MAQPRSTDLPTLHNANNSRRANSRSAGCPAPTKTRAEVATPLHMYHRSHNATKNHVNRTILRYRRLPATPTRQDTTLLPHKAYCRPHSVTATNATEKICGMEFCLSLGGDTVGKPAWKAGRSAGFGWLGVGDVGGDGGSVLPAPNKGVPPLHLASVSHVPPLDCMVGVCTGVSF